MKVCCVSLLTLLFLVSVAVTAAEDHLQSQSTPVPDQVWPLDSGSSEQLRQKGGSVTEAAGARNQCLVLDGKSLLEAKNSTASPDSHKPFTLTIWFNPYNLDRDQQMLAAKNRYSLNEREWGVMVDRDKKLRLYVRQSDWKTVESKTALRPGHWHHVGVVVRRDKVELWLNGKLAGTAKLSQPIATTKAPLTFGGVDDNGRIWQTFQGALDDVMLFNRPLEPKEMAALYTPVVATHQIPDFAKPFPLWDESQPLPTAADYSRPCETSPFTSSRSGIRRRTATRFCTVWDSAGTRASSTLRSATTRARRTRSVKKHSTG